MNGKDEYYYETWAEDGTTPIGYRHSGSLKTTPLHRCRAADVATGDEVPAQTQGPVTRTDIVKYAAASFDFNPIHHDETFATKARSGGIIAHGMMVMGYLGRLATAYLGTPHFDRFKIRLLDVTRPGDVLLLSGRVTDVAQAGHGTVVTLVLRATRNTGDAVAEGQVVATLRD